jgi:hypothetical protein
MGLVNEAAYLYVHSKQLLAVNRKMHSLSKKAAKHVEKHGKATSDTKRQKHKVKYGKVTEDLNALRKKQVKLLKKLHHHQIAFTHNLQKQKL